MLLVRSIVDTAICSKPLGRWTYGDWMPPAESRDGQPGTWGCTVSPGRPGSRCWCRLDGEVIVNCA